MNSQRLAVALSVLLAITTHAAAPADQWKEADKQTTDAALKSYDIAKSALLKLDYSAPARTLADNRRPMLPTEKQTDEAVAELAAKLKEMAKDLEKTQTVVNDADAAKPKPGKAVMQETTSKGMKVLLVKVSLSGTREVAEKHQLGKGRLTTDDEGNLAVLMVRHEGTWFWNPFGW